MGKEDFTPEPDNKHAKKDSEIIDALISSTQKLDETDDSTIKAAGGTLGGPNPILAKQFGAKIERNSSLPRKQEGTEEIRAKDFASLVNRHILATMNNTSVSIIQREVDFLIQSGFRKEDLFQIIESAALQNFTDTCKRHSESQSENVITSQLESLISLGIDKEKLQEIFEKNALDAFTVFAERQIHYGTRPDVTIKARIETLEKLGVSREKLEAIIEKLKSNFKRK